MALTPTCPDKLLRIAPSLYNVREYEGEFNRGLRGCSRIIQNRFRELTIIAKYTIATDAMYKR